MNRCRGLFLEFYGMFAKGIKASFLPEPVGPKSRMLLLSNWILSTSESSMSLPACSCDCVGEWTPLAPKGELRFDVCVISICNSRRQLYKTSLTNTCTSYYRYIARNKKEIFKKREQQNKSRVNSIKSKTFSM